MPDNLNPEDHMRITLLVQGNLADGRAYWAYVAMRPAKAIAFKQAMKDSKNPPQPGAYGDVVEWGEGEAVPQTVRTRMEQQHGVNHGLEAALKEYNG